MEKELNKRERNTAFWKFLLFFVIAVVAVVTAVYFNFRMPMVENKILKTQIDRLQVDVVQDEKFISILGKINLLIDSIDKVGIEPSNQDLVNSQITLELRDLNAIKLSDNSSLRKMQNTIVKIVQKYQGAKRSLVNLKDAPEKIDNLKSDLESCKFELDRTKTSLEICMKQ